jgi:hypothetical protein
MEYHATPGLECIRRRHYVLGNGSFRDGFFFQDQAGLTLAGFSPSGNNPVHAFLGVISDTPIWRIVYQDTNITGGRVL